MDLGSVDLAMKVQTTLERKSLDNHAANALRLIQSAVEESNEPRGGRHDRLGNEVDKLA